MGSAECGVKYGIFRPKNALKRALGILCHFRFSGNDARVRKGPITITDSSHREPIWAIIFGRKPERFDLIFRPVF